MISIHVTIFLLIQAAEINQIPLYNVYNSNKGTTSGMHMYHFLLLFKHVKIKTGVRLFTIKRFSREFINFIFRSCKPLFLHAFFKPVWWWNLYIVFKKFITQTSSIAATKFCTTVILKTYKIKQQGHLLTFKHDCAEVIWKNFK